MGDNQYCRSAVDGERDQNAVGGFGQTSQHKGLYGSRRGTWIFFSASWETTEEI